LVEVAGIITEQGKNSKALAMDMLDILGTIIALTALARLIFV
jgi:hypothetical protein